MLGPNQDGEREGTIDEAGTLTLTWDSDQNINPAALVPALDQPGDTAWTEVVISPGQSFDAIWLRLAAAEHGTCRLAAENATGVTELVLAGRNPAVVEGDSFTYLTMREIEKVEGTRRFELGAAAYGPDGEALAARFADLLHA